jgi:hypothetical protein
MEPGENSQSPDCLLSHVLRNIASVFFVADKKFGAMFLCLNDRLRFSQVQVGLKKPDVPLIAGNAPMENTCVE